MKITTLILAFALFFNIGHAKEIHSPWNDLLEKIVAQGTFQPGDNELPSSFSFHKMIGHANDSHIADYIYEWGYFDFETNTFYPEFISIVSEQWTLTSNNDWGIDQWVYLLNFSGETQRISHTMIAKSLNGNILEYRDLGADPQDPQTQEKLEEVMHMWEKYNL